MQPPAGPDKALKTEHSRIGAVMITLAWLVIFGLLIQYFSSLEEFQRNPNQNPDQVVTNGRTSIVLRPNQADHYVMSGEINGQRVTFLIDTGATNVAVPEDMAGDLGLDKNAAVQVYTANGVAKAFSTRIDKLSLGGIRLSDIEADITPGMNGTGAVLLGMSALSKLEFSQKDGKLTLTQ